MMKIGIVGSGKIVRTALETLRYVEAANCAALCVRPQSVEKGRALAAEFGIPRLYTDYADLLRDDDVDFVYIGLPNQLHGEYTRKALAAGKHVILEKPFTPTAKEARELAALAKARGLYLFEAITNQYNRNYRIIRARLGELGTIRLVQCNYSQYSSRYDRYQNGEVLPAFDPACYGGALCDIGVYNLHFVIGLFGSPQSLRYTANRGWNGVDTSGVVTMTYEDFVATCACAKDSDSPGYAIIQGERGYMRIEGSPSYCPELEICIGGEIERFHGDDVHLRMKEEFEAFARIWWEKDYASCIAALDHTVRVAEALEAAAYTWNPPINTDGNIGS
jgi:predicted dehydrogenase